MWDSTVSYWSPSVASFVAFLCICTSGHTASLSFFVVFSQNGARLGLDGQLPWLLAVVKV